MQKQAKKVLVLSIGIIFLILGLVGLVLPFLQGIIFLAIGFFLISLYFPKGYLWMEKHTQKYPRLSNKIKKMEIWIKNFIGEV
jgi:uncharacterized membrane protein YbaN (DUF454 family)